MTEFKLLLLECINPFKYTPPAVLRKHRLISASYQKRDLSPTCCFIVSDLYRGSEHLEHTTQYGGEVQLIHYRVCNKYSIYVENTNIKDLRSPAI